MTRHRPHAVPFGLVLLIAFVLSPRLAPSSAAAEGNDTEVKVTFRSADAKGDEQEFDVPAQAAARLRAIVGRPARARPLHPDAPQVKPDGLWRIGDGEYHFHARAGVLRQDVDGGKIRTWSDDALKELAANVPRGDGWTREAFDEWIAPLDRAPATPPTAASDAAPPAPAASGKAASVPAEAACEWFWGTLSPTRYWYRDTGEFAGHGYSGALSYVFNKDGTYHRYFYLEQRLGDSTSGVFSASEGTVRFDRDTFTLRPTKGTYRFTEGSRKKRERPMERDELERPGLVFKWRLETKDGGPPVMMIGKEGEEPRPFNRGTTE